MRDLIIFYIRESRWYSNYLDESENIGIDFNILPDSRLLEYYDHIMTH